jgi:dolichyl-phosphate-mannose--protein O-mannosyl transferase
VLYQYYALPAVPFMVLALTLSAGFILEKSRASPRRRILSRAGLGTYTVLVAVNFFYLYPILAAELIPYSSWQGRLWFGSWL